MILRILAIVAAVAAAALFFLGKGKIAEQQAVAQKAQADTQAVQTELAAANEQVSALESRLVTERESLADAKRNQESIRSEMYTARQELNRTQQQLSEARNTIADLENTARRLRSELLTAEQNVTAPSATGNEAELTRLNDRIAELEQANAELRESLKTARERATTERSTASGSDSTGSLRTGGSYSSNFTPGEAQPLPTATLGVETTIQSVSAQNGLIVLANKEGLNLSPGLELSVIKDRQSLGKIQIVRVQPDLVVANLLPGANTRSMSVGSTVNLLR
jgi:predicted  nucleic acid-binding Zn-ribbon protein